MSYKTLIVHLDTSARSTCRLSLALRLARTFASHLNGIFASFEPNPHEFYVMAGTASYYEAHQKLRAEQRGAMERLFRAELLRAQVEGSWVPIDSKPVSEVVQRGRTGDLVILGQTDPDDPASYVAEHFPETVALGSGGPVLMLPHNGRFESVGERVLVAWNGSREAARAVHDALPFITRAARVTVASANSIFAPAASQESCAEVAVMLARHGATNVDITRFDRRADESSGTALLNFANEGGYDLLVMGAYGHTRIQELILGGATRSAFDAMTVPVLLAH